MSYDRTAYFEQRNEARNERLAEESYQRNLARARTGESTLAHAEGMANIQGGLEALGQTEEQKYDQRYERGLERERTGEATAAHRTGLVAIGLDPDTYKAAGGPVGATKGYVVGERGPEIFIPKQDGMIVPNHKITLEARAAGGPVEGDEDERFPLLPGSNSGAGTRIRGQLQRGVRTRSGALNYQRRGLTPAEATVEAARIKAGEQESTNRAHVEAQRVAKQGQEKVAETQGQYGVKQHEAQAYPQLVAANTTRNEAERKHMETLNTARKTEYDGIKNEIDKNWPQTVLQLEEMHRRTTGQEMSPEEKARLQGADERTKFEAHRRLGTNLHAAALNMGLPKEGEPLRPGQLATHGYKPNSDGSWSREARHELSGVKYVDKFVPGAEGVTRKQEMAGRDIKQGPGIYNEGGQWYGSRSSGGLRLIPKVVTMEQALSPENIAKFNAGAGKVGMGKIDMDLVKQNPGAAAWQVLTGINKLSQSGGDFGSYKHLDAQTYMLNDDDTQKAILGHNNWRNVNTAPPTAPAGTPAAVFMPTGTAGPAQAAPAPDNRNDLQRLAHDLIGKTPEAQAAPGTPDQPQPAQPADPNDPALQNRQTLARAAGAIADSVVAPPWEGVKAAAGAIAPALQSIGSGVNRDIGYLANKLIRNTVPGSYKTVPDPENPIAMRIRQLQSIASGGPFSPQGVQPDWTTTPTGQRIIAGQGPRGPEYPPTDPGPPVSPQGVQPDWTTTPAGQMQLQRATGPWQHIEQSGPRGGPPSANPVIPRGDLWQSGGGGGGGGYDGPPVVIPRGNLWKPGGGGGGGGYAGSQPGSEGYNSVEAASAQDPNLRLNLSNINPFRVRASGAESPPSPEYTPSPVSLMGLSRPVESRQPRPLPPVSIMGYRE
jgi:hypothetical protein